MGSFQQILLGGICLAAAFGMGHYLNNKPVADRSANAITDSKSDGGNGFRMGKAESPTSFLESSPLPPPTAIVTIREPVRSNVPTLKAPSTIAPTFREGADQSDSVQSTNFLGALGAASIPNVVDNQRRRAIVVPDFSELAASFKNTPLELPPIEGNRPPNSQSEVAQSHSSMQNPPSDYVDPYADGRLVQGSREQAADFTPEIEPDRFRDASQSENARESRNLSPVQSQHQALDDARQPIDNRVFAAPPLVPDFTNLQREPIDESRVVSLRAEVDQRADDLRQAITASEDSLQASGRWAPANQRDGQQVENRDRVSDQDSEQSSIMDQSNPAPLAETRPRIPFGLTDEAKTELVGLRKPADRKLRVGAKRFEEYVAVEGDTLQSLSTKYYGRPDFYLDIYLSNQTRLRNPAEVPVGTRLQIPIFE